MFVMLFCYNFSDEENTGDSLDIKPPQATKSEYRYKEKKKDKKHSRERKHKDRHRERSERHRNKERYQGSDASKSDREVKYEEAKSYHKEKEQHYKSQSRSDEYGNKSDNEKLLEDLRSRLLSRRQGESYETRDSQRSNYERKKKREHYSKDKRDRASGAPSTSEANDGFDIYNEQHTHSKSHRHHRSFDEKEERRNKLLLADREMAKRKEKAREELQARREQRREREGDTESISLSPEPKKKRYTTSEERELEKADRSDNEEQEQEAEEEVLMLSDEDEEEEEKATDSNSSTNTDEKESDAEVDEVSPISVGQLMKSDHRKHESRSHSKTPITRSPTKSRSVSRSRSRSTSHSRSHSTGSSDSESGNRQNKKKDTKNPSDVDMKATEPLPVEEVKSEEDGLPPYLPAIQGCRSVEEFQCLNRIEEGTYGVVYRAKDKRTSEIVALKRLKMEKEKEGFPITSLREINTLLKGQHPNIVTVREIVVGSNMDKIFIVMDYVEHDLKSLIETMKHKKQVFLPGEVKCLAQQLMRAVEHLHRNWILHRDLKTSNLLLSHKGILKVGDFGLAREYGSPLKAYTSIVVTLWYRSPELLLGCKEYSTPIDVWSVGCIFAELLSMMALFPGKSEADQLNRIFKDLGTPNERIWPGYDQLPLVQKMTFTDYPVSQLRKKFAHHTSELGMSLLQGLLTYDPKQRLTAETALKHHYFQELPLPIDPAMFPTWPAKSEVGWKRAMATSPKPPSGGGQFKKLVCLLIQLRFTLIRLLICLNFVF